MSAKAPQPAPRTGRVETRPPAPPPTAKARRQWERHRRLAVAVIDQALITLDRVAVDPLARYSRDGAAWRDGVAAARAAVQDLRDAIEGGGADGGAEAG